MIYRNFCLSILIVFVSGCSTVATRSEDGTLTLKGLGKATWSDGTSIEGEPLVKFPEIPLSYK